MKVPGRLVIAGLVLGTAAVSAPVASADPPTWCCAKPVPRGIVAGANYTGVIVNGLLVIFECHAAAVGTAVSVAITDCYVTTGTRNYPIAMPGAAAVSGGTDTVSFLDFRVCWRAVATFVNATSVETSGCTGLASLGGVPSLADSGMSQNFA